METKLAIIDVGSNTIRIKIYKVFEGGYHRLIDEAKESIRLSENMEATNCLSKEVMEKALNALKLFKSLMDNYAVDKVIAVATEAIRRANNKDEFLQKIKSQTGIEFVAITGQQEAYTAYLGVIHTLREDEFVMIDTGGGSSEIAYIRDRKLVDSISLPMGSVVLTEKFLSNGPSKESMDTMEQYIYNHINKISWLKEAQIRKVPIVGLGGSIRTMAKVDIRQKHFPVDNLHNYLIEAYTFYDLYYKIGNYSKIELINGLQVPKDRVDIILAGLTPLKVIFDLINSSKLIVSVNGLREGLFFNNYSNIFTHYQWPSSKVTKYALENLMHNFGVNRDHSYHIAKLALSLFDQLKLIHNIDDCWREVLWGAALLHDIGMYINVFDHHKHSFYIILSQSINGFTNKQLLMCALMTLLHRNELVKTHWTRYKTIIDSEDMEIVKICSTFLRISEMLDRSESQCIRSIDVKVEAKSVTLGLDCYSQHCSLEIDAASKSCNKFRRLLGRELVIKCLNH